MRDWHPSKPDPNRTDAQIALPHQVEQCQDAWPTPKAGANRNSRQAITGGHPNHPSPSDLSLEQAAECAEGILPREVETVEELPKRFRELNWPTPMAADGEKHTTSRPMYGGSQTLTSSVHGNWPTPRCEDGECAGGHRGKDDTLYGAIVRPKDPRNNWPTITASDQNTGSDKAEIRDRPNGICTADAVRKWSTPNGDDANNGTRASGEFKSLTRDVQTVNWATPVRGDGDSAGQRCLEGSAAHPGLTLTDQVQRGQSWATPKARDFRSGCTDQGSIDYLLERRVPGSNDLTNQVTASTEDRPTGTLNPEWVEILMGWPQGWTDPVNPCPGIWPGWPAGMGPLQYDFEPPRIAAKGAVQGRVARIKACGNGVVPQQAAMAYGLLLAPALPYLQEQP